MPQIRMTRMAKSCARGVLALSVIACAESASFAATTAVTLSVLDDQWPLNCVTAFEVVEPIPAGEPLQWIGVEPDASESPTRFRVAAWQLGDGLPASEAVQIKEVDATRVSLGLGRVRYTSEGALDQAVGTQSWISVQAVVAAAPGWGVESLLGPWFGTRRAVCAPTLGIEQWVEFTESGSGERASENPGHSGSSTQHDDRERPFAGTHTRLALSPTPAREYSVVEGTLVGSPGASISLFDVNGRLLASTIVATSGRNTPTAPAMNALFGPGFIRDLPSGVYLLRATPEDPKLGSEHLTFVFLR
ncbi:MAG: T9SS type A sorting domain-containing protein [Candidatus Eisenbacteria bacterium]|nr:T9SS type A sorting domain-containing protein [Candidatus Eisenbacteria bacterium]